MITRNKTARAIIREIWKLWRTVDWIDEVSTIEIGIVYESAIRASREAERPRYQAPGLSELVYQATVDETWCIPGESGGGKREGYGTERLTDSLLRKRRMTTRGRGRTLTAPLPRKEG
jgi:hypothetical protein